MATPCAQRPRLAVLASGTGRTLQNLLDRIADGRMRGCIAGVSSDRADAFALQRALEFGVEARMLKDPSAIWSWIEELDVDLVLLAGYLRLLPVIPEYEGRVLNIHPSLLPEFGGKGMYGEHVHAAVLAAGRAESGCTVHLCNNVYDDGRILVQARVPVLPEDTAPSLAARVFAAEAEAYPAAIAIRWHELQAGREQPA
ncbi:MAG: phosphoribosylglycinamide formyltransferase [Planctomycetes bacterium]|nr:phosphoribosylglycinamide formyltransferase [Planctomycetota bacterium]